MDRHHPFLHPECSYATLDIFGPRQAILKALTEELPRFHGTLLDVGCGRMPYRGLIMASPSKVEKYLGLDMKLEEYDYGKPDIEWDGRTIPLPGETADCALATEVFEHCPDPESIMREILRVLKPGGLLFFTVPFLWPFHDIPHDEYRYTPFALERLLGAAGYGGIRMKPNGGWDASLAQMIGLWMRRRPMNVRLRGALSRIAAPLVRWLFSRDVPPLDLKQHLMVTGISGIAIKPSPQAAAGTGPAER